MALRTRRRKMHTCQREQRLAVIECRRLPCVGRMTRRAIRREPGMRRRIGCCEIRLMASDACRRRIREHSIQVTLHARHGLMRSREREADLVVIECRRMPSVHGMARRAIGGESRVLRIRRTREIGLVAADAGHGRSGKHIVDVALRTYHCRVRADKREADFVVIEVRRMPCIRRMARHTVRRESIVPRVPGIAEIRLMAPNTRRRRAGELVVLVAGDAWESKMRSCQRESDTIVIETCGMP